MRTAALQKSVRPAAVAGQFYPSDAGRLGATVRQLLDEASAPALGAKAVIAPHAGYIYSGSVAAEAFAALRRESAFEPTVLVIGPAHYVPLRGIALPSAEAFQTPLGSVPVNRPAAAALRDLGSVVVADAPHAPEHALEVELPFLQELLGGFSIVPLLVGEAPPHEVAEVIRQIWDWPESLIVVSSDLSHYHAYEAACRLDRETAALIESRGWAALSPERACGYLPIAGLLIEAERRDLAARRLALRNSGDTAGPRGSVVGYGAWAFVEPTGLPASSSQ